MAKPTKLPVWNTNETLSTEPDASHQSDGWAEESPGVGEQPPLDWFNFWMNLIYKWIKSINEQGVLEYDALTDYTANSSIVAGGNNIAYSCLINNGPSSAVVNPVGDATGTWEVLNATWEPWQTPTTFESRWGFYSAGDYTEFRFRRSIDGTLLQLRGAVQVISASPTDKILTFPVGYRPLFIADTTVARPNEAVLADRINIVTIELDGSLVVDAAGISSGDVYNFNTIVALD